jgi:predicted ATPase
MSSGTPSFGRAKRIVLTGGPGAGKTAVLELARLHVCEHVAVLPEAASMLFGGGFPRVTSGEPLRAAQRAIFHVQHELEIAHEADADVLAMICDRGTVDGAAYWRGPDSLFDAVGTTHAAQLARYQAVIHLRTPHGNGYNHDNRLRIENAHDAARIDNCIGVLWEGHKGYHLVPSAEDFVLKTQHALALLFELLPHCCERSAIARERVRRHAKAA